MPQPKQVRVRVPGSSANLGAGFDALGIALAVYLEATVEIREGDLWIEAHGREADQIDVGPGNLVYQRILDVYRLLELPVPAMHLRIDNQIPLLRGLGASGAATIAGLVLGNALTDSTLRIHELLRLACRAEGHPDNVTPSLVGGFVAMALDSGEVRYVRMEVPDEVACVVLVPRFAMKTAEARRVLPEQVPMSDAVFNLSRSALAVAAVCSRRWDLLGVATQDRLHQPYRQTIFPAMEVILQAARQAGAHGACLSGAGSTLLAISPPRLADQVAQAMRDQALRNAVEADTLLLPVDNTGAIVWLDPPTSDS